MQSLRKSWKTVLPVIGVFIVLVTLISTRVFASNTYSLNLARSSNQYTYVLNSLGIHGSPITIEAWVKLAPNVIGTSGVHTIASQSDSTNKVSYFLRYLAGGTPGNNILQFARDMHFGPNGQPNANYTVDLVSGVWYHIVGTYDGTILSLYVAQVNGTHTLVATSAPVSGNGNTSGSDHFVIGSEDAGETGTFSATPGYSFDGLVDDVRVWNFARTLPQLDADFQQELAGNETGLVGYYKLNNDYTDATSNGNILTPSGNPTFSTDTPFGIPSPTIVLGARKSVSEMRTSSAAPTNDSDLKLMLSPNTTYIISGVLFTSSTNSKSDIKVAFDTPTDVTMDVGVISSSQAGVVLLQAPGVDTGGLGLKSGGITAVQITGTIKTGSTVEPFNLQWAQNVSSSAQTSVLRGSYLKAEQL